MSARIPLRNKRGDIVAWAICDRVDYADLSARRWHLSPHGYARTALRKNRHAFMHTLLMGARGVDHINGNRLDNRRTNLRRATQAQNMQNVAGNPNGSSRFRGVSWHKRGQKWMAYVTFNGTRRYLGLFSDELAAAAAAKAARERLMSHTVEDRNPVPPLSPYDTDIAA